MSQVEYKDVYSRERPLDALFPYKPKQQFGNRQKPFRKYPMITHIQ